jgi:hypothetical protein
LYFDGNGTADGIISSPFLWLIYCFLMCTLRLHDWDDQLIDTIVLKVVDSKMHRERDQCYCVFGREICPCGVDKSGT